MTSPWTWARRSTSSAPPKRSRRRPRWLPSSSRPEAPSATRSSGSRVTRFPRVCRRWSWARIPVVAVNCSAFPEHLIESELFGHERGSFTDAHAAKPGLFEVADRGTLFLDEIGDLPLSLQAKLLRVLEDKQIRRVGGTKSRTVDVR